jgi:2'-5' RNA ligase
MVQKRNGAQETSLRELKRAFSQIVDNVDLQNANLWLESAKALLRLRELGYSDEEAEADFLHNFNTYGPLKDKSFSVVSEALTNALLTYVEDKTSNHVANYPVLQQYMSFVESLEYTDNYSIKTEQRMFVTLKLPQSLVDDIALLRDDWAAQFPGLKFTHENDLHMTISFVGAIASQDMLKLLSAIAQLRKAIEGIDLTFSRPGFEILGRNNNLVALVFDYSPTNPAFHRALENFRERLVHLGVKPDRYFGSFKPHITIAESPLAVQGEARQTDLARFVTNATPLDEWSGISFSGDVQLLAREQTSVSDEEQAKQASFFEMLQETLED